MLLEDEDNDDDGDDDADDAGGDLEEKEGKQTAVRLGGRGVASLSNAPGKQSLKGCGCTMTCCFSCITIVCCVVFTSFFELLSLS